MNSVIDSYKQKSSTGEDVMGVIRTLFPDITVETFLEHRSKKVYKSGKKSVNK